MFELIARIAGLQGAVVHLMASGGLKPGMKCKESTGPYGPFRTSELWTPDIDGESKSSSYKPYILDKPALEKYRDLTQEWGRKVPSAAKFTAFEHHIKVCCIFAVYVCTTVYMQFGRD